MPAEAVLVESFEAGRSVAQYMRRFTSLNTSIVSLGVDAYLKMLLADNFVHTDLHPGNILCRTAPGGDPDDPEAVELVLLDYGLAEELTPEVRRNFIGFLMAIASGDGQRAAETLLLWSPEGTCADMASFEDDMRGLFRRQCDIRSEEGIDVDAVLKATLQLCRYGPLIIAVGLQVGVRRDRQHCKRPQVTRPSRRKHGISIQSSYAALVVGVCVIVGFATSLDPGVNLMDAAIPCFHAFSQTGRVMGRLYM